MAQPVNIIDLSDSIESIDGESDRDLGKDPATPQCSKRGMPAVTSVETSQVTASAATGNFVKVEVILWACFTIVWPARLSPTDTTTSVVAISVADYVHAHMYGF